VVKLIRRYGATYLVIGFLWGAFAAYHAGHLGYYDERNPYVYVPLTWVTNAAAWPVSIVLAVRLEVKK